MPSHISRLTSATVLLTAVLASGCRIQGETAPDGYHAMADGTLMADVRMDTDFAEDVNGDGFSLPSHTRPDGTVILGSAPDHAAGDHGGHGGHDLPDPADFPSGVVPARLEIPRLGVVAPVVPTAMSSGAIQGPPVAGDVAWLDQTRKPGEIGPAILGGVAEIDGEPGAYAALTELEVGDEFIVVGTGGELLAYTVAGAGWTPVEDRRDVFAMGEGRSEVRLVAWATGRTGADAADYVVRAYAREADA